MSDPLSNPPPPPPLKVNTSQGGGVNPGGPLRSVASPNTIASVHKGIPTSASTSASASTSRTSTNAPNTTGGNSNSNSAAGRRGSGSEPVPVPQGTDPLSVPVPLITKRPPPPSPVLAKPLQPPTGTPSSPSRVSRKATTANLPAKSQVSSSPARPTTTTTTTATTTQIKTSQSKTRSADAEVDSFLSGPSQRTVHNEESGPGQLPLLKPPPLPSSLSGIQQLEELARRRAWSDVIRISTELLSGALSPYQKYYSQLIRTNTNNSDSAAGGENNNENVNENEEEIRIQKETVKIIHWRIRSFMYLRRYSELKREVTRMRLHQHSNANMDKLPKWVPLSLILEGIESLEFYSAQSKSSAGTSVTAASSSSATPSSVTDDDTAGAGTEDDDYEDDLDDILDTLYTIRTNIQAAINESTSSQSGSSETTSSARARSSSRTYDWHALLKLDLVLSNVLTRREEWRLALKSLDDIFLYVEHAVKSWVAKNGNMHTSSSSSSSEKEVEWLIKAVKVEIYSRQGKILLQVGALPAAATIFERAHDEYQDMGMGDYSIVRKSTSISSETFVKNVPTQILLNEGLLHFAHMDYDLAETKFTTAIDMLRNEKEGDDTNTTSMSQRELYDFDALIDTEGDLIVPCLNNLALCALYTCRMREAVDLMEGLVRENPSRYLTQSMAFNLCTLHELGADNTTSDKKKRVLQLIAKRFSLHDIGNESFRLN